MSLPPNAPCPAGQTPAIARRGLMLVLSSPSGAGKSTISRALLETEQGLAMSISATTRPPRPGEIHGTHYVFMDEPGYMALRDAGGFLEHARVFDNYYGTPRAPVEEALARGQDVLFDVDWQGTQQLREAAREDLVSIFILPPALAELERRLKTRAQDSDEVVARRMSKALDEISHWGEYDYIVVNEDIETAIQDVRAILRAERLRRSRQSGLFDFISRMRDSCEHRSHDS